MQTTLTSNNAIHRPMPLAAGANELASSERPVTLVESTDLLRGNISPRHPLN